MSDRWFDPIHLFAAGYPEGITSALRALPELCQAIRDEVTALRPRLVLEVGPGDVPLLDGLPGLYVDIVPRFLVRHAGRAARADIAALPFAPGAFDVALAADVFTHIPAARRPACVRELARVARSIVLFNPEPGTADVDGSSVPTEALVAPLEAAGLRVKTRRFVAWLPHYSSFVKNGEYVMTLTVATPA